MSKKATKASDNVFYLARDEAASFNERLGSREGAAEELGIDRTRIARIETGILNPYPEEVLLMADCYNAPEICYTYCSSMCPLGKKTVPNARNQTLDTLTVKTLLALRRSEDIQQALLEIAEDGVVTSDEEERLTEVAAALERIEVAAQEVKIWLRKNGKGGKNNE